MRIYFTYSESIRHFQDSQYEFGKRIPLKLLQAFSCKTENSEMSGFKKKNLINSVDETSKYVAQNRQRKIISSLPLKEKTSINKPKMYESTTKLAPVSKTTCDLKPTQSNAFTTGKNIVLLKPNESKTKIPESSDFCISKVGSLTASPKWARIKDKFENADPTRGSKLSRSSSLPRNDSESLKIKATFTKTSSRSLTSLCYDNSLSTFNKDYSVKDTSYRQMLSVDKSESPKTFHAKLKSQNSDGKSVQKIQYESNHTTINETQNSSSSRVNKCNIVPISSKMLATAKTDLKDEALKPKSTARLNNIPLSARAAALSLLPVSTRSSNISKKSSSISKSKSSVITSKANEDIGCLGSNKQVSSKPSCKSIDQLSEKITQVRSENLKNRSNKFKKNTIASHLYKSPVLSNSSEDSSVSSKTDKKATCLSVPITNTGNASCITESKLGIANNVKETQSKVSTFKSIPTVSAQHISQFDMKIKNTWVKDKVGNWTKIAPSDKSELKNSGNVSSKVAVLKNKFNSCSVEAIQEKITTSPLDNKIVSLSKSHTTCNVPSKVSEKEFETEQSRRPLCKSNTTSNICTKVFPSHHSTLNADTHSKCQKGIGEKVSENKQNNSFLEFRCMQNASSSKTEDGTINSMENSPEQIRKLSIVQRAVLSYEENLTLSPEMQRKLKLIGEEVKAETDDDKLFIAKARNDILTLSSHRKNNKQQQNKGQMNDPRWKRQADISSQDDELQQPVRSFLSRYQHMNKNLNTIKDIKVKKLMKESVNYMPIENKGVCNAKGGKSDNHHTFATSSTKEDLNMLSPSYNTSINNSLKSNSSLYSNIRCDGGNVVDSGSQFKVNPKPLKGKQDPPLKNSSYMNHLTNESQFLYDRFSSMEQELSVPLQPNASFLWRHSDRAENDCARSTSLSSTKSEGKIDDNYYDLENYYSSLEFDGDISKSNQEEHIYIDSEFNPIYSDKNGLTLLGTKYQNIANGINQEKIDTDDGWTDLSDEEITTDKAGSKTSTLSSTLKRKKNKKCTKIKGQLHRSWSQSLRDIATADASETSDKQDSTDWANEDYHDPSVWKTSDIGSNSETTDIDHFYEPVYESLGNYLVTQDSDESYSVPQSSDDKISKKCNSSTSIESVGNVKSVNDQCSDVPLDFQSENPDISAGISKKAGDKIRQLKRHLSWTKNDIRFELTSKFNKIKIRKNLHSATEIGVRVHEGGAAFVSPKKRTFIKCILKQKNPCVPDKRSPSPKKESALFYVHLSMSSEKQRPFSDSCVANISTKGSKNDPALHKSRKTSEPSLQTFNKDQQPFQRLKRGSSGITIQRPKTPPPLPPVKYVPKHIAKSNSDLVANKSSIHRIVNKGMSLDSAYKSSNSSDISDKSSMDNASCVNYDIRKSFSVPDSKLLPHKFDISQFSISSGITEASVSQSAQDFVSEIWSEDRESLSSLTSVIDSLSASDMFFKRTRSSVASSASSISVESYIPPDDSGSSSASSATAYTSSGITPPVSEISLLQCRGEHTVSVNSDLSLPPFKDFKTELLKSPFEEEPMYQFYHKDAQQRATLWCTTDGSESEFEEDLVNKMQESYADEIVKSPVLQSQLSAMDLVHGDGGQRTLWCEVPEVQKSGILEKISSQDRKIQEAMFEVITSEASYLRSLNFLLEHFVHCPEFSGEFAERHILDKRERHILFSDIQPVRDVSARLLSDLEKRWLENILLSNVCDIIYHHASKYFSVYVKYCSNQLYQDRIIKELKGNRPEFVEVLKRLELSAVCQGLDMHSFVMLPMQRITRLPLLVDAIFHRLPVDSPIYDSCKMALATLNKIVAECNEGARKMERMEEMLIISHQLDFRECKGLGLLSASRWLVKKGELVRLLLDTANKRTFSRNVRWCKIQLYLFLFTDLLVITRKKSDDNYYVVDYCPRNMVQVMPLDENAPSLSVRPPSHYRNLFQMIMLNNQEGRTVEMLLSCLLESDRTRWMDAVTPAKSENPDEKIYEEWDCPQIQCTHAYTAQQPDELTLEEADVVNVFRKVADGWYEGERIRDGIRGWFPASHTVEIISSHVRARNLRQRYRLLMLSQTYLEDQYRAQMTHGKNK